ncbi:MAG: radical SAM protein [Desulfamplus sp.]|nr:radical SAM protein [Desulfamplus sp.]
MYKYLFGPVQSRRLGVSLGVDLVTRKICSLDCVYCECGSTTELTLERKEYVPYNKVIEELRHYLLNHPAPNYITFSGSGEPTLNSRIGDVIEYIKSSTPQISVAVLTNGTLLGDKAVRNGLLKADLVVPSLDAASLKSFKNINHPHNSIDLVSYIQGIVDFRDIYKGKLALEILILPNFNDSTEDIKLLKDACYKINPDVIQLNTLDRPGAIANLIPASQDLLESIRDYLQSKESEKIAKLTETQSAKTQSQQNLTFKPIPVEIIASRLKGKNDDMQYRGGGGGIINNPSKQ